MACAPARSAAHGLPVSVPHLPLCSRPLRPIGLPSFLCSEEKPKSGGDPSEWYLGEQAHNCGSIYSDVLSGFAADLAERVVVAVYPVSGWWKDQPKRDRSYLGARYALVVSLETPGVETDLWTPVAQQVGVPIEVAS